MDNVEVANPPSEQPGPEWQMLGVRERLFKKFGFLYVAIIKWDRLGKQYEL